ncbi:MAG: hypothetical protein GY861_22190 [bacterium]|nr:hypothetical protein [bacterium]
MNNELEENFCINKKNIDNLKDVIDACTCFSNDPYMRGKVNGMMLALHILTGEKVKYINTKKDVLCDKKIT